jgi:hypothetical protein
MEVLFSAGSATGLYNEDPGPTQGIERVQLRDIRQTWRTGALEAEESPLLTSVTRKRLVKANWEYLVFAAVIWLDIGL